MVSTRQMSTYSGNESNSTGPINTSNSSSSSNIITTNNVPVVADESSARLSVVTRQNSSSSTTSSSCAVINSSNLMAASVSGASGSGQRTLMTRAMGVSTSASSVGKAQQGALKLDGNALVATNGGGGDAAGAAVKLTSLTLVDLPNEILTTIFSYLDYKKVGHARAVSHKINDICMHILNATFSKLITRTFTHFHAIKANMPRRESARRNHPMACECDIIETCYMRLSLLQMTFGKHIERGHCCFFPGAILDEIYMILNTVKRNPRLERPFRVTDELFDLSTMAMEYFRDRIEPTLPGIVYFNDFKLPPAKRPASVTVVNLTDSSSSLPSPPQSNMVLRKGIRKIKEGMRIYNNQLSVMRNELRTCKRKSSDQGKQIGELQKLLGEQQKQTVEYANRLDEYDKKNEEMSRKFSTLLQELNKCKTELQYWRSKSPAIPTCTSCGQKVAPVLAPEDYQALINQGVRSEDIVLNLSDDIDAESDASTSENNLPLAGDGGFVSPDEVTTAKLFAVNTATRNLKRQYAATSSTNTSSSNGTIVAAGGIGNGSDNGNAELSVSMMPAGNQNNDGQGGILNISGDRPTEMTNCLFDYGRGGHTIIRAICSQGREHNSVAHANAAAAAAGVYVGGDGSDSGGMADLNTLCVNSGTNCNSNSNTTANSGSYSTKLFYGMSAHKGVIVSPSMLAKREAASSSVGSNNIASGGRNDNNQIVCDNGVAATINNVGNSMGCVAVEEIGALNANAACETKKARRVQKATRCGSGSGKRGKY